MPELPEVEGFRKYIAGTSLDQLIRKVEVTDAKVVSDPVDQLTQSLTGARITGTDRVGKYLFLEFDSGANLMMHFGMTGSPKYYRDPEDQPRHARVIFHFDNEFKLAYNCPRKFGRLKLTESVEAYCTANKIGPDAKKLDWETFQERISGRKTAIKAAMMNQSIFAGAGNWIVDEVLYQAAIHPEQKVKDLKEKELKVIFEKLGYVIDTALKHEAHFPDFPKEFMIHSRWTDSGRPDAPRLDLEVIKVGGRSTYFDPKRQKL